jgi:recombination protein RecT
LRGFDQAPLHNFSPFGNRGAIQGVYVVVKTADGEYLTHTMSIAEVYAIRDRASQSYKGGKSSPWKSDEVEMIKKTCVKQAYKYWPKVERLQNAIHFLNTLGGEGLNELANQPKLPSRNPNKQETQSISNTEHREKLIAVLEDAAKNGLDSFRSTWSAYTESEKALVGLAERNRIDALAKEVKPAIPGEVAENV